MNGILSYLQALEENNNREWYHANKEWYMRANHSFLELIRLLILELGEADAGLLSLNPAELTFKLMRDTRFSADKAPYNPSLRAHISSMGKLPVPVGFYLMIRPGNRSILGGGLFADMFKDATDRIRSHIANHSGEWDQLISTDEFVRHFTVKGAALKNVPRNYPSDHPQAAYLKHKSWYLEYQISDGMLTSGDFIPVAAGIFRAVQPFNAFLNRALDGFRMPER